MPKSINFKSLFPKRKSDTHKGDYGKVFILAGSRGLSGASILAAQAAMRSGAGLVTVGVPESLGLVMARRLTEAMWFPLFETEAGAIDQSAASKSLMFLKTQDVLAIGPGLSRNSSTQCFIRKLILSSKKPMVIDADALNALAAQAKCLKKLKSSAILTPHPVEFERVFGKKIPHNQNDQIACARAAAREFQVVVVLKGFRSIVAGLKGEVYVNLTGNPGMATGGSGDVLTGITAAFLGQGLQPFDAACAAVYFHGLAGDIAAKESGEISLVAGDLIQYLPKAFKKVLK